MTYTIATMIKDDAWTRGRLKEQRINTSSRLLEQARGPKGRKALSEKIGISESEILDLANAADLLRIKGMGIGYIRLLRAVDVPTMRELRCRRPDNLRAAMKAANDQRHIVDFLPGPKLVAKWIEQAKQLQLVIVYK